MNFTVDELLAGRDRRSRAWTDARLGRITTAELYAILRELRKRFGTDLYDR